MSRRAAPFKPLRVRDERAERSRDEESKNPVETSEPGTRQRVPPLRKKNPRSQIAFSRLGELSTHHSRGSLKGEEDALSRLLVGEHAVGPCGEVDRHV